MNGIVKSVPEAVVSICRGFVGKSRLFVLGKNCLKGTILFEDAKGLFITLWGIEISISGFVAFNATVSLNKARGSPDFGVGNNFRI